ncbi:MAG: argininosuccinate lyase [Actinomycetota bacterium]
MSEGKKLWGGRFASDPHPDMLKLTRSIEVDRELLPFDLAVTGAHARALSRAGLLSDDDVDKIDTASKQLLQEWEEGTLTADSEDEDIHSFVERVLTEKLGDTGARVHAGRSRNDLVVTDLRLWCKAKAAMLADLTADLVDVICRVAREHDGSVMPGYTHMQRAQPVSLAFHLLAHGFALARDGSRFVAAYDAADVSCLGAGALAGTTLPLDPAATATDLGFSKVFSNAMDAVSDRDFACDLLHACALCGVHLSRLGEEIVLWTGSEFGFATLAEEWSTGSSMMPQKRNPDLAELIRGRAAPTIGELASLLALLKGLPLAYDRDLQEDKQLVFAGVARTASSLAGTASLMSALRFDLDRMGLAAAQGKAWATDLAEVLVVRGVPFRQAHSAVGSLVSSLERKGSELGKASEAELKSHHDALEAGDTAVEDPVRGMRARSGPGGPGPERVAEQIEELTAAATRLRAATRR